eukprot:gene30317-biopygen16187
MRLANVQELGLEVGTAEQVRLIPCRYIPGSCAVLLLAAMDSETRQAFRAVSKSCRQSVHAYTTTLKSSPKQNGSRKFQKSIPKCPNVRRLEIHHFPDTEPV